MYMNEWHIECSTHLQKLVVSHADFVCMQKLCHCTVLNIETYSNS